MVASQQRISVHCVTFNFLAVDLAFLSQSVQRHFSTLSAVEEVSLELTNVTRRNFMDQLKQYSLDE